MKQFWITLGAVFAGMLLAFVVMPFLWIVMIVAASQSPTDVTPSRAVLTLDLRQPLPDQDPVNPFAVQVMAAMLDRDTLRSPSISCAGWVWTSG